MRKSMGKKPQEGQVVVTVRHRIRNDDEDNTYVCHFVGLGLIARGKTEDEAVGRCKRLFSKFVKAYREVGQLEERLNQSGSEWHWLEDYSSDAPPPEFLGDNPLSLPTLEEFRKAVVWRRGPKKGTKPSYLWLPDARCCEYFTCQTWRSPCQDGVYSKAERSFHF